MPASQQAVIKFPLDESVWFEKGQEVDELISISLNPNISIFEEDEYVVIKGTLDLGGEYQRKLSEENAEEISVLGRKYVQTVENRGEGENEFLHQFPVDITIPRRKISNIKDVEMEIYSFDYELPQDIHLQIVADVHLHGIQADSGQYAIPSIKAKDISESPSLTFEVAEREDEEVINEIEVGIEAESSNRVELAESSSLEAIVVEAEEIDDREDEKVINEIEVEAESSNRVEEVETDIDLAESSSVEAIVAEVEDEPRIDEVPSLALDIEEEEERDELEADVNLSKPYNPGTRINIKANSNEEKDKGGAGDIEMAKKTEVEAELQPAFRSEQAETQLTEEAESAAEFYEPFTAAARIIAEYDEEAGVQNNNAFQFQYPQLPDSVLEALAQRTMDYIQSAHRDHPVESSPMPADIYGVEESSSSSSSQVNEHDDHHMEEKNEEKSKKKKDKYKSMSFSDFFARKEEGSLSKLKVCLVQQGDSIQMLAEKYKISVHQILRANHLDASHEVYEGQVLYIPVTASS